MLRLNLKREPYWIDLPADVKLFVRPLSTAIMSAAQSKVIKELAELKEKTDKSREDKEDKELENESKRLGLTESLLIKALARVAIIKWEGVMDADNDVAAEITDKNVNDLMDIWFIAQEFWKTYTESLSLLEAEGKFLKPELNGTLREEQTTVKHARKKIFHVAKVKKVS